MGPLTLETVTQEKDLVIMRMLGKMAESFENNCLDKSQICPVNDMFELPDDIKNAFKHLDIRNTELTWSIHRGKYHVSMNLTWKKETRKSHCPTDLPGKTNSSLPSKAEKKKHHSPSEVVSASPGTGPNQVHGLDPSNTSLDKGPSRETETKIKTGRKKKTPSQRRRDRKRLMEYRARQKANCQARAKIESAALTHILKTRAPSQPKYRQSEHFVIKHFNHVKHSKYVEQKPSTVYITGSMILGFDLNAEGKPEELGVPPDLKVPVATDATILDLKESIAGTLNAMDSIPVDCLNSTMIRLHHIICYSPPLLLFCGKPPRLIEEQRPHTFRLPNFLPLSIFVLEKGAPKFSILYDIMMCPEIDPGGPV